MARDPSKRFSDKQKKRKLSDMSRSALTPEEMEAEEELLANTPRVEPIKADKQAGRNDPCPCGSGKKYKKCCWDKDHK
jgi:uncharacterized protein YchJ